MAIQAPVPKDFFPGAHPAVEDTRLAGVGGGGSGGGG